MKPENGVDFLIVGSGFGGAIAAMRLAQKGYSVAVLEKGKRFTRKDFPKTNWQVTKYLWAPLIRCFGIQQITLLKGVMVLHGSGVGGGSLVYANTLMRPRAKAFAESSWPSGVDWEKELSPYYQMVEKMLGVTSNQKEAEADQALRVVGAKLGVGDTYHPTQVGVFFGRPGQEGIEVPDPYFGGEGPSRAGCIACGGCMVGCRHGAKNTLDLNYLYFAEKASAKIYPQMTVTRLEPITQNPEDYRYQVIAEKSGSLLAPKKIFLAKNVILSAGVIGTLKLLFHAKEVDRTLPKISSLLGEGVRTNGESLCGATSFEKHRDLSRGIAIGSAIHIDEHTKIEPCRYPAGSDFLRFLAVPLTDQGSKITRPLKLLKQMVIKFPQFLKLFLVKDWARSSVILLVMQSLDQKMRLKMGRSILTLWKKDLIGDHANKPISSFMPIAQKACATLAEEIGGIPQNIASEVILATPATAHILGGACLSTSPESGVIDLHHQVFGYAGLYVCDGSVIPANLGVNPSLTISALAERFATKFPPKLQA